MFEVTPLSKVLVQFALVIPDEISWQGVFAHRPVDFLLAKYAASG